MNLGWRWCHKESSHYRSKAVGWPSFVIWFFSLAAEVIVWSANLGPRLPRWLSDKRICLLMWELQETQLSALGQEGPLEKEMASILAWRILWTEESGRLQSMGSQKAGHDWAHMHANLGPRGWCVCCFGLRPMAFTNRIKAKSVNSTKHKSTPHIYIALYNL